MIFLSHNEIENGVYKAAEANGLSDGVCVALMHSVTVLESLGCDALAELLDFLGEKNFGGVPKVVSVGETVTVDLNGGSCLLHLTALAAFVHQQIADGHRVKFVACRHLIFLAPSMLGMNVALQLQQRKEIWLFDVQQQHPKIMRPPQPLQSDSAVPLSAVDAATMECVENPAAMAEKFQRSLRAGIAVSLPLWQRLNAHARQVLVPDSEASLQGAGESPDSTDTEDIPV